MNHITKVFVYSFLALIALAAHCYPAIADQTKGQTMQSRDEPVFTTAEEIVDLFRRGGSSRLFDTRRSLPHLLTGNRRVIKYPGLEVEVGDRLSPETIKVLGEELAAGPQDIGTLVMRKKIIDLLDDLRHLTTPGNELRDPDIIALLFGPGFAKPDGARGKAIDLLRKDASPATLLRYRHAIMQALKESPDDYVFLLVAKAKPPEAREELEQLSGGLGLKIARAALGDTRIEDEFIATTERAEKEGKAKELHDALFTLARVCTPRTLRAICMRLRSPLVIEQGGGYIQLVRIEAMKSLHYAYPGETAFEISSINERMFDRAEEFCTRTLGVDFKGMPRPEFNY